MNAIDRITPWIGVDLDGTLAYYDRWRAWDHIGPPLAPMVARVQHWLAEGRDVRIFTARIRPIEDEDINCLVTGEAITNQQIRERIQQWCLEHIGVRLPVTCIKDVGMIELWDDRAIQMVPNTGRSLNDAHEAELSALRGKP